MTLIFLCDGTTLTTFTPLSGPGPKSMTLSLDEGFELPKANGVLHQEDAWKLVKVLTDWFGVEPEPTLEELVRALAPGTVFETGASCFGAADDNRRVRLSGDNYLDPGKNIQPISLFSGEQGTVKIIHPKEDQ